MTVLYSGGLSSMCASVQSSASTELLCVCVVARLESWMFVSLGPCKSYLRVIVLNDQRICLFTCIRLCSLTQEMKAMTTRTRRTHPRVPMIPLPAVNECWIASPYRLLYLWVMDLVSGWYAYWVRLLGPCSQSCWSF